ncbi:hypothetical protein [uncultured Alistipes sp.]|uniref:hypothetical protein n=1 Tax=uncultured Alistipes sp. TaxID=538949 RepID=UPI0025FAB390|nr:hypothetical protein [uncultured Alistipes sp.]
METNPFIRKLSPFFTGKFSLQSANGDTGLDHLRQLLLEAHKEYQNYVATGIMTARVFALQFLDGHHYVEDKNVANKNMHRKALRIVSILLLERTDLVKRFFTRLSLDALDIDKMIFLVYTERRDDEIPNQEITETINQVREQKLSCTIRAEDMFLLADCANNASFFQCKITVQEMNDLMHGTLTTPLVAANLMGIAYFFDCLSVMNLICRCWQTVLERCGSILLQGKKKPQSRTNYSSALNRVRSNGIFRNKDDIDILMKHIREKYAR